MSKKVILKRNLPQNLIPKEENVWLIQPVAATWMRYDYSLIQSKIFLSIINKLQFAIHDAINNNMHLSPSSTLFSDEQFQDFADPNSILLRLSMSEFGVAKNQYAQLKEALRTLVLIPIQTPIKDNQGKEYIHYDNLCEAILPKSNRITEVLIKIKKTTAMRLLNLDFGYHSFLAITTAKAENKYLSFASKI